ncbi:integrase core domain protein [Ancylostoma caninum]|uniref:Integrase core domain protein n=1 Tax=Ancylostoma caninum TaxID=29170 RepID=A0A368GFH5_ANCCA|nr:integrase core domain protein [Ancylostoma caninum]
MQYIVLPHADLVFKFSNDYLPHAHLTEQCKTLGNSYLTTSNQIYGIYGSESRIATRLRQRIHPDVIGPLHRAFDGNKFITLFIGLFSKFIIAEPIADQKANTTAQIYMNRFVARFGPPEMLLTNRRCNCMSDRFRTLLRNLNIQHRTSTPYHHESNEQVERAYRTIQEQIVQKKLEFSRILPEQKGQMDQNSSPNWNQTYSECGTDEDEGFRH